MEEEREVRPPPADALGRDLHLHDDVAYVARRGSSVVIDQRVVTDIIFTDGEYRLCLDYGRATVKPTNTVRL